MIIFPSFYHCYHHSETYVRIRTVREQNLVSKTPQRLAVIHEKTPVGFLYALHRLRKHGVKEVNWPPLFQVGVKDYLRGQRLPFDPPLLTCTKHAFCSIRVTIMHHQHHSLHPLRTQNWHVYVLQSLSSATTEWLFFCPQKTENIHQTNNVLKPSHSSSFATCLPRSYGLTSYGL